MEGNANDLHLYTSLMNKKPSPMKYLAEKIVKSRGMIIPKNMEILLADIRRDKLFNIFESLYDFDTYCDLWIPKNEDYVKNVYTQYTKSKAFEKDLLYNGMVNRKKCMSFMMSLIDPTIDYPSWFKNHVDTTLPNRLKDLIVSLHKNETRAEFLKQLRLIINNVLNETIGNNSKYSDAMRRAQGTYRPKSVHFVADKYDYFNAFIIVLTSIFMDMYCLALVIESSQKASNVVFIGGASHTINIVQYLNTKYMVYTKNAQGNLDMTTMTPGLPNPRHIRKSPHSLLRNFLQEPNFVA
jgi:hypothetical protein